MPQWETIYDESSHISPVRITPTKNHSTNRGDEIYNAVLKSSIQPVNNKWNQTPLNRKKMSLTKLKWIRVIFTLLLSALLATLFLHCSQVENESSQSCSIVSKSTKKFKEVFDRPLISQETKESVQNYYTNHIHYQPAWAKNIHRGYHWFETTSVNTAVKEASEALKPIFYAKDGQFKCIKIVKESFKPRFLSLWTLIKEYIKAYLAKWRQQIDEYIDSGHTTVTSSTESGKPIRNTDDTSLIDDTIKKTARRMLEYIDHKNEELVNTGMKRTKAKEKAREIIQSITSSISSNQKNFATQPKGDSDVEIVAYEIQSILNVADKERTQLKEQLALIQSRLPSIVTEDEEDKKLLIHALKREVDQLRVLAETNVRERTAEAQKNIEDIKASGHVATRMKDDIRTAQRSALKDLRQIYQDIIQTNEAIDKMLKNSVQN